MGLILTRTGGSSVSSGITGVPGDTKNGVIVPPNTTLIIDTYTSMVGSDTIVKWIVQLKNLTTNNHRAYEVLASRKGMSTEYNEYSHIGDKLDYITNVTATGGTDINLTITNNEVNDLTVSLIRIQLM